MIEHGIIPADSAMTVITIIATLNMTGPFPSGLTTIVATLTVAYHCKMVDFGDIIPAP